MHRRLLPSLQALGLLLGLGLLGAPAHADEGPAIDLAPEHEAPPPPPPAKSAPLVGLGAAPAQDTDLVRGLTEQRFRKALESLTNTSVGGYGEIQVRGLARGREGETEWTADVARLVLFVAHSFTEEIRAYTELEVEHSVSCSSCPGAVELEQAYLDYKFWGDRIGARAGLVLVPMGIINQWHEPPIFHGVVRPKVETVIIPSTWREVAVGVFGRPTEWLRYELYAMTGFDPLAINAGGLSAARQQGALASAKAWSGVGRVEVEPLLGAVIGASFYAGDAGKNAHMYLRDHQEADVSVPLVGWDIDLRFRRSGLEWKALYAEWRLPQSGALMHTYDAAGTPYFPDRSHPLPTVMRGGYVEGAYDVLRPLGVSHQLLPFARVEFYDTQAEVPEGETPNPTLSVREYTFGASYRPIRQVVLKGDYQLRNRRLGLDERQINFGIGFMY
ncbi:MAG: hypothetical protein U0359_40880 [Byssovorax sp.]